MKHREPFKVISPSQADALKSYTYNGSDNSLIYKYVLSPFAGFLVRKYTPNYIAPNVITLCGLFFMVSSYMVFWYFCPSLNNGLTQSGDIPNWIFFFSGSAMLWYQTLDNMDGKQARATKTSSPLGMLFDHGCDAFNSVIGSTNWICAMGVGADAHDLWRVALMVFFPMVAFFITTWEEHHMGKLILPIINGPTEGLLLGATQMFITGVVGVKFWHKNSIECACVKLISNFFPESTENWESTGYVKNIDIVLLTGAILLSQEIVQKIRFVILKKGLKPSFSLLPMISLILLSCIIFKQAPIVFKQYPRICLQLGSALFVEFTTALMLSNLTKSSYNAIRWTLFPLLVLAIISLTCSASTTAFFVIAYSWALWVFLVVKFWIVINEICSILGIWCFDIVTPYKKIQ